MCYYIYGALFGEIDENEYQEIENKHDYKIHPGTKHDVKTAVQEISEEYRVTDGCCDCESALGKKNSDSEEIKQFDDLFNDIKNINGAKHIYLCKTWEGKRNKREIKLKLSDIDVKNVLAEFEDNCLYIFEI